MRTTYFIALTRVQVGFIKTLAPHHVMRDNNVRTVVCTLTLQCAGSIGLLCDTKNRCCIARDTVATRSVVVASWA